MWSVREKGGCFIPTHGLRCAVTPVTQLQHGIYGRDVRKRPAAHAGPVKMFAPTPHENTRPVSRHDSAVK